MNLDNLRGFWLRCPQNGLEAYRLRGSMKKTLEQGLIQVYEGPEGHHNTAPLGLALRASGHGLKTFFADFTPGSPLEDLERASRLLGGRLVVEVAFPQGRAEEALSVRELLDRTSCALAQGDYDLVILEGIGPWVRKGGLRQQELLILLEQRPRQVELILSGPSLPEALVSRADLVTQMEVSIPSPHEPPLPFQKGFVEVVSGDGKGKSTYAFGRALLHAARGEPSRIFQFVKAPGGYGEIRAIQRIPLIEIRTMGKGFVMSGKPTDKHQEAALEAWKASLEEIRQGAGGVVILDEIHVAIHLGLLPAEKVWEGLLKTPPPLHLILTGRYAPSLLVQAAQRYVCMKEVRHPFHRGVPARKGIEF
ncbi:MAG: cob(I)yrinic acid a,c-diamide adenosyltransferase [Deltaproteobacteria bacterium]|nr:cob(I)yrinic acid a,c-diamide adenosyltransferase [Deltaproteobacteria bacterium]